MYLLRDDINEIADLVLQGNILCYPTDTVWAIGGDATNPDTIDRLRSLRQHPEHEGMLVLVDSIEMLKQHVVDLPPRIETLLSLHHRPFSLIYADCRGLAPNVGAADHSVAIRVTYESFSQLLIKTVGRPIVATGPCSFGTPYPTHFGAISSDILGKVDYVVKYRQDEKKITLPSPLARLDQFQELDFIRE